MKYQYRGEFPRVRNDFGPWYHDLTNGVFGRLTALTRELRVSPTSHHRYWWRCQCECGEVCFVSSDYLLSGHTRSCGCMAIHRITTEVVQQIIERRQTVVETVRQTARHFGVTIGTIIGVAWRAGLCKRKGEQPMRREPVIFPDHHHCTYPHGDPGELGFHFCGRPNKEGSSYCPDHHERVYIVPKTLTKSEAAAEAA